MSKFKICRGLIDRLKRESDAFVIVNAAGGIDVESMAWSQVPTEVQSIAMQMTGAMLADRETVTERRAAVQSCNLHLGLISVGDERWAMVSATTNSLDLLQKFAHEDVRPIFHWH